MNRHDRQIRLPEIGPHGQARIAAGRVLVIGAGGLGCPALQYLAAAGVGQIHICDADTVDLSNLQRQILYTPDDVGQPKVEIAAHRLRQLDPALHITPHIARFGAEHAALLRDVDVILDATDNFSSRYLISALAAQAGKPVVFGAVSGFAGQLTVFHPPAHACYRCLHPEPPRVAVADCATDGIVGAVVGVIGVGMALQALYVLLSSAELPPLYDRLQLYDFASGTIDTLALRRRHDCPGCRGVAPDAIALLCASDMLSLWVDVRTIEEFAISHRDGALNLPLASIEADPAACALTLPTDRPILLHCRSGQRARRAADLLAPFGLTLHVIA